MRNREVRSGALTRERLRYILIALAIMASCLLARAFYLVFDDDFQSSINLKLMTREPTSLQLLEKKRAEIDMAAADIGELSLNEIQALLSSTSVLAGQASRELKAQEVAWEKVKSRSNVDAATYEEIKRQLNDVTEMQSQEIIRLTTLLDEARSPSFFDSIWGLAASMLVGILSSLAATYLKQIGKKKAEQGDNVHD